MQQKSICGSKRKRPTTPSSGSSLLDQTLLPEWLLSDSEDDEDFYGFPLSLVLNGEPSDQSIQYTLSKSWSEVFGVSSSGEDEFEGFSLSDL